MPEAPASRTKRSQVQPKRTRIAWQPEYTDAPNRTKGRTWAQSNGQAISQDWHWPQILRRLRAFAWPRTPLVIHQPMSTLRARIVCVPALARAGGVSAHSAPSTHRTRRDGCGLSGGPCGFPSRSAETTMRSSRPPLHPAAPTAFQLMRCAAALKLCA